MNRFNSYCLKWFFALILALVFFPAVANNTNTCADVDPSVNPQLASARPPTCEAQDMSNVFSTIFDDPNVSPLRSESDIYKIAIFFWSIFVYISLIILLLKYAFGQAKMHDVINTFAVWILTGALIHYFNDATNMIVDASKTMRGTVQIALYQAAGYTGPTDDIIQDAFFAPKLLWNIFSALHYDEPNIFQIMGNIINYCFFIITCLIFLVLALVGILLSFWTTFGIYLAKILGLYFVPFLMFKKTAPYFDSWIKFFIGYVLFGMISQILLTLPIILLLKYFIASGIAGGGIINMDGILGGDTLSAHQLDLTDVGWQQMCSMIGIGVIGLIALLSTSKIVSKLTGGVGGGMGNAISSTVSAASKLV